MYRTGVRCRAAVNHARPGLGGDEGMWRAGVQEGQETTAGAVGPLCVFIRVVKEPSSTVMM